MIWLVSFSLYKTSGTAWSFRRVSVWKEDARSCSMSSDVYDDTVVVVVVVVVPFLLFVFALHAASSSSAASCALELFDDFHGSPLDWGISAVRVRPSSSIERAIYYAGLNENAIENYVYFCGGGGETPCCTGTIYTKLFVRSYAEVCGMRVLY